MTHERENTFIEPPVCLQIHKPRNAPLAAVRLVLTRALTGPTAAELCVVSQDFWKNAFFKFSAKMHRTVGQLFLFRSRLANNFSGTTPPPPPRYPGPPHLGILIYNCLGAQVFGLWGRNTHFWASCGANKDLTHDFRRADEDKIQLYQLIVSLSHIAPQITNGKACHAVFSPKAASGGPENKREKKEGGRRSGYYPLM